MMFHRHLRRKAVKLEGERSSSLDLARGRLVLISGFFVLIFIFFAIRAFDLTIIQHRAEAPLDSYTQLQEPRAENVIPRADVTDRNGVLLATTLKTASLYADPHLISDPETTAKGLSEIFPQLSYGATLQKLQSNKRFIWLERNIRPDEQQAVLRLGEPGLDFEYEDRRVYPQGAMAAHLLGYTSIDNKGQAGIERSFDKLLGDGEPLALTLDMRLQHALRREIQATLDDFSAKAGMGVIMDVGTGEILAGVSLPDFDPHNAGRADKNALFNRLSLGVYELGSVFKIFSTAALFETLDVPMRTTFDASEPIKVGRFTINDYHAEDRVLTVPEVFMYSSNIGSAMMGQAVGTDALKSFYKDLGLLDALDFEIREVTKPLVPHPWGELATLTASYGHGIATTPLHLITAVSSIVNGGYLVKPKLVVDKIDGEAKREEVQVVSAQTAHRMRQLLRLTVTDGTGKNADVPGYLVGGKTGTAEKSSVRGYDRKKLISSFVAVFPMDAPRYAVFIAIDEPQGTKKSFGYATAGWTAAPAVQRVISSMVSILGIEPRYIKPEQDMGASLKHYVSEKAEKDS